MPYSRSGVSSPSGFNSTADAEFTVVTYTLTNSGTLKQGQVLCRDVTQLPGASAGADIVVVPTSANAGPVLGAYQGNDYTNSTGASQTLTIEIQTRGAGLVYAGTSATPTRVTVGGNLVITSSNLYATQGVFAIGTQVGTALATGANTAVGANLTGASSGNTAVINAQINPQ